MSNESGSRSDGSDLVQVMSKAAAVTSLENILAREIKYSERSKDNPIDTCVDVAKKVWHYFSSCACVPIKRLPLPRHAFHPVARIKEGIIVPRSFFVVIDLLVKNCVSRGQWPPLVDESNSRRGREDKRWGRCAGPLSTRGRDDETEQARHGTPGVVGVVGSARGVR